MSLWRWYNRLFRGRVFKISIYDDPESANCRGHMEEMFWVLSSSMFAKTPSFPPHFRSHFDSFGVHFEIREFKRGCFHPAPSKMNIWLKDKTQGVENQSVNCTISGQPAPSCSHQASWLAGFKAKRRRWREEVCPVVIDIQSGLELKKDFFFL